MNLLNRDNAANPMPPIFRFLLALLLIAVSSSSLLADDVFSDALKAVSNVKLNGEGNESAVKAMKVLNAATPDQIPQMLEAMDSANSIALNWLRSAVNQATRRADGKLPIDAIEAYFKDQSHSAMGRLLAFELMTQGDESRREKMIEKLIDDPSLPLRELAVDQMISRSDQAIESNQVAAVGMLAVALSKARDVTQVQTIASKLEKQGVEVDLCEQLGFLTSWHLVGSFDNKDMKGFDVPYGPEGNPAEVDLGATYEGIGGSKATWKQVTSSDAVGNLDLNETIGKVKGATVYAYTTFRAQEAQAAQIRIGTANATKIWLNGELVMSNEIYHNSNSIDKFSGDIQLKQGKNTVLMKVCQNEQTEEWAQDWQFQLRICDSTGKAVREFTPPRESN